jgi:hypothetical protein
MCQKILKIPMCIFDVTILALVFAIIASPAIASPTINVSALHGGAIPAQPLLALPPGFVVDTLAPPANESGDEGIPKAPSSLRYVHAVYKEN